MDLNKFTFTIFAETFFEYGRLRLLSLFRKYTYR